MALSILPPNELKQQQINRREVFNQNDWIELHCQETESNRQGEIIKLDGTDIKRIWNYDDACEDVQFVAQIASTINHMKNVMQMISIAFNRIRFASFFFSQNAEQRERKEIKESATRFNCWSLTLLQAKKKSSCSQNIFILFRLNYFIMFPVNLCLLSKNANKIWRAIQKIFCEQQNWKYTNSI